MGKRRSKRSRIRGSRTCGWAMKKHKGKGNRGGKGMAGSGKKGDAKKSYVLKYLFPYFGKQGFTSRSTKKDKSKIINLKYIAEKYKPGEINLEKYRVLGDGEIKEKFIIKAKSASKSAIEKVEKAGGKIIIEKKARNTEKKEKKPETKKEEKAVLKSK